MKMVTMEKNEEKVSATATKDVTKPNYRGIKVMPYVIGNEAFEKLGTIGTSTNLLVYLTTVFNMKSITATTLINIFNGTTSVAAMPGAFLCDTYFGRYKTLGFASVASFLGMLLLTLTAAVPNLHPSSCQAGSSTCAGPTQWQMAFLLCSLGLLVVGAGGIRPCNLAFGADQFDPTTESGKRGVNSFFNWYYFTFTFAMMVSLTVIVYVQSDVSWAYGLAIPTFLMFMSCAMFFIGTKLYVKVKPDGSALTSALQVIVAAARKRNLETPKQPELSLFKYFPANSINSELPYTDQFRFLDKAAIVTQEDTINADGSAGDRWRLCSMQRVEEAKCLLRVIPISTSAIIYFVAMIQQQTYVVFQALQADRRVGAAGFKIPAASYTVFTMITLTIWIPVYDRILMPRLRRLTGKEGGITVLQKMGIGMVLAIMTMILSALVEERRRHLGLANPIGEDSRTGAVSSMSASWLIPQLALIGLSEAFCMVAYVEFYYKEFPENMRSIGGSFTFVTYALSNYLSGFLVSLVHAVTVRTKMGDWLPQDLNKGRLDYFYYFVAALGVVNLGYFLVIANWYKYKGTATSVVDEMGSENNVQDGINSKPLV